ncbi:MAG: CRISPR-associated helicase Cas3' [Bacteroidia bacterium]|nr:CRISPR-associated helicase Cas3' [Bacteroidia bacterium]
MDILAKSEPRITLKEHIEDCLLILEYLKSYFPTVTEIITEIDFWETVRLSVIMHDLGKAHSEFAKVLQGLRNEWNKQRHELFSLPFIEGLNVSEKTKLLINLVVAGHHKDFESLNRDFISNAYANENANDDFDEEGLMSFQDEFKKVNPENVISFLNEHYGIQLKGYNSKSPQKLIFSYLQKSLKSNFTIKSEDYFELLLLFGALKHCDHLGSAKLQKIECLEKTSFFFLDKQRTKLLAEKKDFYSHQLSCSNTTGNAILTAPTGSGKTESALLWVRNQLNKCGQGRVFYVLPFTASINAMYERLSSDDKGLGSAKVGMLHGKLQDYLYDYLDKDTQYVNTPKKEAIEEIRNKFKTLSTPLKVITPFQLIKNLYGLKGFEQGILEWTGGYFIFDEIHAYSPEVFAQIKVFLEYVVTHLKGNVFIMTATMPSFLKKELENAIGPFSSITADKELYEKFNRHQLVLKEGLLSDNIYLMERDLKARKKVLVVCNTVLQSQAVFKELKKHATKAVLLHSAFTGEDRNNHEKALKDGEKDKENPIQLLVGTQAIEVSLDIDYDMIYTEPAPIDALIQRFGRVNRKREKGICPVIVFKEANKNDKYIYNTQLIERTIQIFEKVIEQENGILEEYKLQEYIDFVYPEWNEKDKRSFDETYNLLKYLTEMQLVPLLHSKNREDDFYRQFDGIKVLPLKLKERFENYLSNFDFIGAERLKVQIRKNKFAQLLAESDQNLYKASYHFETEKGNLITVPYWILTKKYDKEIGLLYDEQEVWKTELI